MLRWLSTFFRKRQLLMQLFPGADARVNDWDINFRTKTPHADHFARKVINANTFAHLEHEDVAALGKASGLDDESGGLRNVHEITGHIGVRDGDWASKVNLSGERWDDAAPAAEHISKTNGGTPGAPGSLPVMICADDQ